MLSDLVSQRRGDDRLAHDGVLGHRALLNAARADVVEQQNADLVAGEQLIAAVLALDGDADAVRVGVGGPKKRSKTAKTQKATIHNFRQAQPA